jgi:hypothetical protein
MTSHRPEADMPADRNTESQNTEDRQHETDQEFDEARQAANEAKRSNPVSGSEHELLPSEPKGDNPQGSSPT